MKELTVWFPMDMEKDPKAREAVLFLNKAFPVLEAAIEYIHDQNARASGEPWAKDRTRASYKKLKKAVAELLVLYTDNQPVKDNSLQAANVARESTNDGEGVYLIECGGFYKIGSTKNVNKRISMLQTGNPYKLTLFRFIPTNRSREVESHLHRAFSHKRISQFNEWFLLTEEDLQNIGATFEIEDFGR